jgi:hypothetical protein
LAVWALVLGIASFVVCPVIAAVAAIVTGVKGKKAVDRSGGTKTGRGMALAGEILGIVGLVGAALLFALIVVIGVAATKHSRYDALNRGDCFNRISTSSVFSGRVNIVDCSKPHDAQATGRFEAADSGSYPGASGFQTQAEDQCSRLGNDFITGSTNGLHLLWYYPDESTWNAGTRTVVCAVTRDDHAKMTGTLG